jgi:hypothetical protein
MPYSPQEPNPPDDTKAWLIDEITHRLAARRSERSPGEGAS